MPTTALRVEASRSGLPESVHRVSAAVVDAEGRLLASAGEAGTVTWWRSAAKPFQALPCVEEGAADGFGFTAADLALACASHSSEPHQVERVEAMMARAGVAEPELACGPHPPLSPAMARLAARGLIHLSPRWSNCSGKHTAMLALARHRGWPTAGYQLAGHPVQARILETVARWTGVPPAAIGLGVDGCTAACFALPLDRMAYAYARCFASDEEAPRRLREAMQAHPALVAGAGRLCTDLAVATGGRVVAKVGAGGIYCAAVPELGLGIALKVEDGDMDSAAPALLAVLAQSVERWQPGWSLLQSEALDAHRTLPIRNTRDEVTGSLRAEGVLRFHDAGRAIPVGG